MNNKKPAFYILAILSFIIPIAILLSNAGYFLGFADAAEFALLTKLAGIAHPPGFPSYIIAGKIWSLLMGFAGIGQVKAMIWFSVFSTALASLLLYITICRMLLYIYANENTIAIYFIAFIASISFITGIDAWYWSGNIEVYSFHILAFAITLYGLIGFNITRSEKYIYIAATGISIALANHHLTMILFLPFALLFFYPLFPSNIESKLKSKQGKSRKQTVNSVTLIQIIKSRSFILLTATSFVLTAGFYTWMFIRAQHDMPFKFGNPDNLSRLFYHLAGGAWLKNTQAEVKGLIALRFPYFMKLCYEQFFLFLPFVFMGAIECVRRKYYRMLAITSGYFLVMLLYQLRIDQTADTDAYMLPAFFILCLLVAFGLMLLISWNKHLIYILPVAAVIQITVHYPVTDKRKFNVSETLMREIDRSSPKNSIILIADWTTVIQYYYKRIVENFRPDLTVLNYDLKFTNYRILPELYPAFYKSIQPEYDHFIELLGNAHPQQIYNTGCDLDNTELLNAYLAVITKMKKSCSESNRAFMCDPKAFVFISQYGVMNTYAASGCFISSVPTGMGKEFVDLDYNWLHTSLLLREPSATDKMVDLEAALDFNKNYYTTIGDTMLMRKAENSHEFIKELQRKMKRNMPFVYRPS